MVRRGSRSQPADEELEALRSVASGLPAGGGGRWSPGHFEFIVLGTPRHPHTAPHLPVRKLSLREVKHVLKSQPEWPISPPGTPLRGSSLEALGCGGADTWPPRIPYSVCFYLAGMKVGLVVCPGCRLWRKYRLNPHGSHKEGFRSTTFQLLVSLRG